MKNTIQTKYRHHQLSAISINFISHACGGNKNHSVTVYARGNTLPGM